MKRWIIITIIAVVVITILIIMLYRKKDTRSGVNGNPPVTLPPNKSKQFNIDNWKQGDIVYHDGKFSYGGDCQFYTTATSGDEKGAHTGVFLRKVECESNTGRAYSAEINTASGNIYVKKDTGSVYVIQ